MLNKKYQVFVSSTFEDLIEERQEVIHALLELDCIPAGMELFPAANEDQWTLIKRVIDECDYYIVIIGGRYGSLAKDGVGYTEKEYDYATSKGKPIVGFVHRDIGSIPSKKVESSDQGKKRASEFRGKVQGRVCKFWSNKEELGSIVSRSLVQLIKTHPAVGWVKADSRLSDTAEKEILELKEQNRLLTEEIESALKNPPKGSELFAQGKDKFEMAITHISSNRGVRYAGDKEQRILITMTWDELFYIISPTLLNGGTDEEIRRLLLSYFTEYVKKEFHDDGMFLHSIKLSDEKYFTIMIQFKVLGYVAQNEPTSKVTQTKKHWILTPYGENVMTRLRAIRRKIKSKT